MSTGCQNQSLHNNHDQQQEHQSDFQHQTKLDANYNASDQLFAPERIEQLYEKPTLVQQMHRHELSQIPSNEQQAYEFDQSAGSSRSQYLGQQQAVVFETYENSLAQHTQGSSQANDNQFLQQQAISNSNSIKNQQIPLSDYQTCQTYFQFDHRFPSTDWQTSHEQSMRYTDQPSITNDNRLMSISSSDNFDPILQLEEMNQVHAQPSQYHCNDGQKSNDFNNNDNRVTNGCNISEPKDNFNNRPTTLELNYLTPSDLETNNGQVDLQSVVDHNVQTYEYQISQTMTSRASSVPSTSHAISVSASSQSAHLIASDLEHAKLKQQRWTKHPSSLPNSRKTSPIQGKFFDQTNSVFSLNPIERQSLESTPTTTTSHSSTMTLSDDNSSSSSSSCTSLGGINYNDLYKFHSSIDCTILNNTETFATLIGELEISSLNSTDQTMSDFKELRQHQQQSNRRGRPRAKKSQRLKTKVNGKLWEFIRDLLLDDQTNPSFIKWERREDGIFKFVQSDKVAKMWGERKQNPKMTYEKLSRAMRYYYKSKVLMPVFGRRLVYKFGPNATGWMIQPM